MKNSKIIIYTGILLAGILIGWLLFGRTPSIEEHEHNESVRINQIWTCSMHPQILQKEPGDCPICGMDLIPADANADGLSANQFKMTENALALANIQTTLVDQNIGLGGTFKFSGKIGENEKANEVQVSFVSGRIEKLYVSYSGETVQKGQLLATIYSPELFTAQQELLTAGSLKASQPELYRAVRNKLKLWKLTDRQIDQIEENKNVVENLPVYATVSGTVSEKLVNQGDYIKQGQPLFKIINLNSVWANFNIYEDQVDLVKVGQNISITTRAYPNQIFEAKVSFIDPVMDSRTRTLEMRAVLNNSNSRFKPGMFVEGTIKNDETGNPNQLTIPVTAVLWTGKRSIVYVKPTPDLPVFEMREVVLGNRLGDSFEIESGLRSGEEIVIHGTFTIDAAAQLAGKSSMMGSDPPQSKLADPEISPDAKAALDRILSEYFKLKNALAEDDYQNAIQFSGTLSKQLKELETKELPREMQELWLVKSKNVDRVLSDSERLDIQKLREKFIVISKELIDIIKVVNPLDQSIYIQRCPMANSNEGADWMSLDSIISNPYYGKSMLTCGTVVAKY